MMTVLQTVSHTRAEACPPPCVNTTNELQPFGHRRGKKHRRARYDSRNLLLSGGSMVSRPVIDLSSVAEVLRMRALLRGARPPNGQGQVDGHRRRSRLRLKLS